MGNGCHPQPGRAGMHAERTDYDNATLLTYEGARGERCFVRVDDNEPSTTVAEKLHRFAGFVQEMAALGPETH